MKAHFHLLAHAPSLTPSQMPIRCFVLHAVVCKGLTTTTTTMMMMVMTTMAAHRLQQQHQRER
jgi:hypothetical protein